MGYFFTAFGGIILGAMALLIWFFRNDRNRWQKMYAACQEDLNKARQSLSQEHTRSHQQEIRDSYEKGLYDARQTDAIYRQLLLKTQKSAKEKEGGNIIPFKNNTVN